MYVSDRSEPARKPPVFVRALAVPSALRLLSIALILCFEILALSVWLEPLWGNLYIQEADPEHFAPFNIWESHCLSLLISFVACFTIFAYAKRRKEVISFITIAVDSPLRGSLIAGHILSVLAYLACTFLLFDRLVSGPAFDVFGFSKIVAGFCAIVFLCLAAVPVSGWRTLIRNTGLLWLFSAAAAIVSALISHGARLFWQDGGGLTFELTKITLALVDKTLQLFTSNVVVDANLMIIGTDHFSVKIGDYCSGFQGIGLMLAFGSIWLYIFRRELIFPRTLLLLPAGIVLIFALNAVRITALILIGNAGAPEVASSGFHSKAGWISFNVAALLFSMVFCRLPWFQINNGPRIHASPRVRTDNPAAAYLSPLVAILATGLLAGAASASFEWLYPLRFFAALAALWCFRKTYLTLDWRFGWLGPVVGVLVFCIWIGLNGIHATEPMPEALASATSPLRLTWISLRALAAATTVPIAEELAFRAFLIRRFISRDFELISLRRFTAVGLTVSSVAFGLMHGSHWLAGIIAGLLYALVMIRRGRIGEAVAAHATTNALLAIYVLAFQKWNLW